MKNIDATIIILDYLKSKRVVENVENIIKQNTDINMEIIIVDNSCNEENNAKLQILTKYKNVKLIINKENIGYIKGNNKGAKYATGEYLFIINPDIICKDKNTIKNLLDFMKQNKDIGICGPKQINDDGKIAMTVRAFPNFFLQVARRTFFRHLPFINKLVEHDEMKNMDYEKIQNVDWLQSSFIVIRSDLWKKLKGFSDRYFLFMSDPDICWRAWENKMKVVYNPNIKVYADGVRCSEGGFVAFFKKWTLRQHVKDSLKYTFKYAFKKNPRLIFESQ